MRNYDKLHSFLQQIIKNIDHSISVPSEVKDLLNDLAWELANKLIDDAVKLVRYCKRKTIDDRAIQTAILLSTNNQQLIEYCSNAWCRYCRNHSRGSKKHDRAGLVLPAARFKELLKRRRGANQQIGESGYIYLTACIEYLLTKIIRNAIQYAKNCRKSLAEQAILTTISIQEALTMEPIFAEYLVLGVGQIPS